MTKKSIIIGGIAGALVTAILVAGLLIFTNLSPKTHGATYEDTHIKIEYGSGASIVSVDMEVWSHSWEDMSTDYYTFKVNGFTCELDADYIWTTSSIDIEIEYFERDGYGIDSTTTTFVESGNTWTATNAEWLGYENIAGDDVYVKFTVPFEDMTMFDIPEPPYYEVNFYLEQNDSSPFYYTSIMEGNSIGWYIDVLPTPTKEGYRFDGWYTNYNELVTEDYYVYGPVDAYARWTKLYKLTINSNGGSTPSPASIEITSGQAIGTLPTVTRSGYRFDGWYIDSTLITSSTTWSYSADKTAVAQWVKVYSITIKADNSGYGSVTNTYSGTYDTGTTFTSLALNNEGYIFKYWADSNGNKICTSNQITITADADKVYIATFGTSYLNGVNVTSTYGGMVALLGDNFDSLADTDTITFVATVALQGYKFSHWEDIDGNILGTSKSIALQKSQVYNNIIKAVFVPIDSKTNTDTSN